MASSSLCRGWTLQGAGRVRPARVERGRPPDRERAGGPAREAARPRIAAADDVDQLACRAIPVEISVGPLESWRQGRVLVALWPRRQRVEPRERVDQDLGAERGEPDAQVSSGFFGADRRRRREQHRARVHARVHLERRDPGHGLAAHDRPLDRRGAAVARQQRAVDVDRAAPGCVEHGLRQDLAERGDDRHVGAERAQALGPLGIAQARRLQDPEPGFQGARLHRWRGQTLSAMGRPVGLRDDRDDVMVTQERPRGSAARTREFRRREPSGDSSRRPKATNSSHQRKAVRP